MARRDSDGGWIVAGLVTVFGLGQYARRMSVEEKCDVLLAELAGERSERLRLERAHAENLRVIADLRRERDEARRERDELKQQLAAGMTSAPPTRMSP